VVEAGIVNMVGCNFAEVAIVAVVGVGMKVVVAEYNLEGTVAAVFENTADNYPVGIAAEHLSIM